LYGIHFSFHWYKKYKNRPRNAGVIIENISGCYFLNTVYIIHAHFLVHLYFNFLNKCRILQTSKISIKEVKKGIEPKNMPHLSWMVAARIITDIQWTETDNWQLSNKDTDFHITNPNWLSSTNEQFRVVFDVKSLDEICFVYRTCH